MRQWAGIDREGVAQDGRRATNQLAGGDVEQVHRGLEDAQPNELLDQVAAGDHDE